MEAMMRLQSYEIADILSDMVNQSPDESQASREQLAEYITGLERRIEALEGSARSAANVAGCLANGILPD